MSISFTAGELQTAAAQLADLAAVINAHAASLPADEALGEDVINDAAMIAGPPWSIIVPIVAPAVIDAIVLIVQNNRSADPGALVPIASGKRGSDPWIK